MFIYKINSYILIYAFHQKIITIMAQIIDIQSIEETLREIATIPDSRKYWLVRTLAGSYYNSFHEYGFIALGHNEMKTNIVEEFMVEAKNDNRLALERLKEYSYKLYQNTEETRPGFVASQVFKFMYDIKKDDIVIIPSRSSEIVSIGYITDSRLLEVNRELIKKTECDMLKRKSVHWIKTMKRDDLDPYLYRVLQAHQAVNDITEYYGDIIERTLRNFYIKNGIANVILGVEQSQGINARDLFELGISLLDSAQDFINQNHLELNIYGTEVKINLNSKGKIQLINKVATAAFAIAVLVVAVAGGGLKSKKFETDFSTDGLIQKIIDYQNASQDREVREKLIKSMDSLKVKSPDDAIKLLHELNVKKNSDK